MDKAVLPLLTIAALDARDDGFVDDYLDMWKPSKPERSEEESARRIEAAEKKRARRAAKRAA